MRFIEHAKLKKQAHFGVEPTCGIRSWKFTQFRTFSPQFYTSERCHKSVKKKSFLRAYLIYTRRHLILEVFRFFIFFKKFLYFLLTMLTTYAWVDRILFLVENVSNALTCRLRFHWITRHSESNLQVKIFWLLTWLATTIVSLNVKF